MTDQRGFSLIELLVAMAAAALLLVALASVTGGLAARARTSDRLAPVVEEARAGAALAALVARAVPTDDPAAIAADLTSLQFAIRGASGEPQTVTIAITSGGSALEVALKDQQGRLMPESRETLLDTARAITISAPIAAASNGDRRLRSIEIAVTRTDGSQFQLAATPRITTRPGCRFDPISLDCRPQ